MDFDKINAFLATAIGGLIFKWLAGGVSSFWSWLNKIHPEEDFLVSTIGLAKPIIRLSLCKYKVSTKPHGKREKNHPHYSWHHCYSNSLNWFLSVH